MKFNEIYHPPFILDPSLTRVNCSESNMTAFVFEKDEFGGEMFSAKKRGIVNKLNGKLIPFKITNLILLDNQIYEFDQHIITIKGWKTLIGMGGRNIHPDKSKIIQKEFGEWLIKTLSE